MNFYKKIFYNVEHIFVLKTCFSQARANSLFNSHISRDYYADYYGEFFNESGLKKGVIAAIIITAILVFLIVAVLLFFFLKHNYFIGLSVPDMSLYMLIDTVKSFH